MLKQIWKVDELFIKLHVYYIAHYKVKETKVIVYSQVDMVYLANVLELGLIGYNYAVAF